MMADPKVKRMYRFLKTTINGSVIGWPLFILCSNAIYQVALQALFQLTIYGQCLLANPQSPLSIIFWSEAASSVIMYLHTHFFQANSTSTPPPTALSHTKNEISNK